MSDEIEARFQLLTQDLPAPMPASGDSYSVESHKFLPAFVGIDIARDLATSANRHSHEWLDCYVRQIDHGAGQCQMYVFGCGVVLFHLYQSLELTDLTSLAVWRYSSYETDIPWATTLLRKLSGKAANGPDYVLSLYSLTCSAWTDSQLDTALRLMASPSVLVDRTVPGSPLPAEAAVEQSLFESGSVHPDMVSFGVQGVSIGYAGWSGLGYHALAPQRALSTGDLVACELTVQMLWCYCHHILKAIEDGRDPLVPEDYGWRFLRAGYSRLTTARAQETSQHCLMREAVLQTSGLPDRLRAAQEALRESEASNGGWRREH